MDPLPGNLWASPNASGYTYIFVDCGPGDISLIFTRCIFTSDNCWQFASRFRTSYSMHFLIAMSTKAAMSGFRWILLSFYSTGYYKCLIYAYLSVIILIFHVWRFLGFLSIAVPLFFGLLFIIQAKNLALPELLSLTTGSEMYYRHAWSSSSVVKMMMEQKFELHSFQDHIVPDFVTLSCKYFLLLIVVIYSPPENASSYK